MLPGMRPNPTSGVISEAWSLYQRHWRHLIPIAAIIYVAIALIVLVSSQLGVLGALIAIAASLIGVFLVQGAVTRAVEDIRDGRADLTVGETFRSVQNKIAPIAGASILAGIGIVIGLVVLIVPGLYLITIWSLIIPAIVVENAGVFQAFSRSQGLVRGNGWNVFVVVVLTFLILVVFGVVLGLILSPLGESVQGLLSDLISGSLTAPFVGLVWTLVYFRLRGAEGPTPPPVT
jgi:hypothetical protein